MLQGVYRVFNDNIKKVIVIIQRVSRGFVICTFINYNIGTKKYKTS